MANITGTMQQSNSSQLYIFRPMRYAAAMAIICITGFSSATAQEVSGIATEWTLQQCIDYALEHNLQAQTEQDNEPAVASGGRCRQGCFVSIALFRHQPECVVASVVQLLREYHRRINVDHQFDGQLQRFIRLAGTMDSVGRRSKPQAVCPQQARRTTG